VETARLRPARGKVERPRA